VGYGDFHAYGVPEAAFTIFYMALNLVVGAYIVGSLRTLSFKGSGARLNTLPKQASHTDVRQLHFRHSCQLGIRGLPADRHHHFSGGEDRRGYRRV
jgi:hypothetical protein